MIGEIDIDKYEGTVEVKTDTNKFDSELTRQFNWVNDTIKDLMTLLSNSSFNKEEIIESQNQQLDKVNTSLQNYKHTVYIIIFNTNRRENVIINTIVYYTNTMD